MGKLRRKLATVTPGVCLRHELRDWPSTLSYPLQDLSGRSDGGWKLEGERNRSTGNLPRSSFFRSSFDLDRYDDMMMSTKPQILALASPHFEPIRMLSGSFSGFYDGLGHPEKPPSRARSEVTPRPGGARRKPEARKTRRKPEAPPKTAHSGP